MAEFLICARSARALAVSASASGATVHALDCFGDTDLRAVAASWQRVAGADGELDEAAVLAAAAAPVLRGKPLIYGGGLERSPALLEALAHGRALVGNGAQVLRRVCDARVFFATLDTLGIACPAVRFEPVHAGGPWLVKREGAAGGAHVRCYRSGDPLPAGCYLQRQVRGQVLSASFVATGTGARVVGYAQAFSVQSRAGTFWHAGLVSVPPPRGSEIIERWAKQLARAFGLRGLNGIDCMIAPSGRITLLELNPRPGASAFLLPGGEMAVALHVAAAADGRLPDAPVPPRRCHASGVVYALDAPVSIGLSAWPGWTADRPAPGTRIEAGQPICTVYASGPTMHRAMADVRRRAALIDDRINLLKGKTE
ncbi:MAG: ATP-grasp domain-containing protein [Gammaproteobacteria bacterium]|nr:ATP-grasp domain-containing protein [Gammaproteobacteria bacterium]